MMSSITCRLVDKQVREAMLPLEIVITDKALRRPDHLSNELLRTKKESEKLMENIQTVVEKHSGEKKKKFTEALQDYVASVDAAMEEPHVKEMVGRLNVVQDKFQSMVEEISLAAQRRKRRILYDPSMDREAKFEELGRLEDYVNSIVNRSNSNILTGITDLSKKSELPLKIMHIDIADMQ